MVSAEADSPSEAEAPAIGPALTRALDAITKLGHRLDLAARVSPADPHQLSIRLADREGETLTLFVEPVREQGNYYRKSNRLGFWYLREEGSPATIPAWTNPLLDGVARIVFSPQHDGVAGELAARAHDANRPQRSPAGGQSATLPHLAGPSTGGCGGMTPEAQHLVSYSAGGGHVRDLGG